MATKRRGSARRKTAGKRTQAPRRQQARKRRPSGGARAGARERRREEAARQVEAAAGAAGPSPAGNGHDPELEQAPAALAEEAAERAEEPESAWGGAAAALPGYARLVAREERAEERRSRGRRTEAEAELTRWREAAERGSARARPETPDAVPSVGEIGVELALGAMRLARTIATAPLRIGLAFLRSRDA